MSGHLGILFACGQQCIRERHSKPASPFTERSPETNVLEGAGESLYREQNQKSESFVLHPTTVYFYLFVLWFCHTLFFRTESSQLASTPVSISLRLCPHSGQHERFISMVITSRPLLVISRIHMFIFLLNWVGIKTVRANCSNAYEAGAPSALSKSLQVRRWHKEVKS